MFLICGSVPNHLHSNIADESVPPHLRGKYLAFDPERVKQGNGGKESSGLAHLAKLREVRLTVGIFHLLFLVLPGSPTRLAASVPVRMM
eukprot:1161747-Pelagomonas_calceolata.AAC.3